MLNVKLSILLFGGKTYIASYEGIATLLIVLILLLKLLINQRVSLLNFKKMIVSLPGEIVFLVMGFLFADLINSDRAGLKINSLIVNIVVALIILVAEYALERWLDDKISGAIKMKFKFVIVFMYVISAGFYFLVVFGGVHNG